MKNLKLQSLKLHKCQVDVSTVFLYIYKYGQFERSLTINENLTLFILNVNYNWS